ncbi:MAG: carbohydrate ABC transporter permease, partial [Caldilineaceae bacterium]|nr:carbohydrate ABC transporter permease [Caldilineaceae bacterium]
MQGTPNYRLRRTVENFVLYLTTAIVLIVIAFPAYWLVTTAIKYDIDAFVTPPIILPLRGTLDNFRLVLNAPDIGRFFANSVFVALTSTGVAILLGSLAAYALAKSYLAFTLRQTAMIW